MPDPSIGCADAETRRISRALRLCAAASIVIGCRAASFPPSPVLETATARLQAAGIHATLERRDTLGPEGYAWERRGASYVLASGGPRGILYGAYSLSERKGPDRIESRPYFPVREWWSAAFQANFNLPLGGAFDRPIEEISGIVSRTIHEAPRYGINTLQLMGRAGEGGIDISWFLDYDRFPKLKSRRLGWGLERRVQEIRKLAEEAHRYGLDFLLWDHELVFPDGMAQAYPEIRGTGYPTCFSHPLVFEFLNAKLDEFFGKLPEVDGIDLTFAETRGYNILEHGGCRCASCSRTSTGEKVRRVVMAAYEACRRHGKRLEVRSYNQKPEHSAVMRAALRGIPKDIPVITKVTVVDFRGVHYPDDPLLGAYPGQPQAIEFTACPEGSGYGYIPALLGDFYRRKIADARERKLAGVAIRTDYHLQYGHATFFTAGPPVLTFDTSNEFNIHAVSRLAWDPSLDLDGLWSEWAGRKYGERAPAAIRALKRSAEIAEGIFFVKGFSLLTHLNMVPHLDYVDSELAHSYLTGFFPSNAAFRKTFERLDNPTEETIAEILAEKDRAAESARQAGREAAGIPELVRGFRTAENAALLWKQIAAVYFRLRQKPMVRTSLEEAMRALEAEAKRIEAEQGQRWPVYPAARGATVYEFLREARERSAR